MLEEYKSRKGWRCTGGDRYLTMQEMRGKLGGRSRSAIYLDLEAGRLPQPVKLGGRLYWIESEVDARLRAIRDGNAM